MKLHELQQGLEALGIYDEIKKSSKIRISGGNTIVQGASRFTQLTDVPSNYLGQSGKVVKVKITEDGLEFGDSSIGGGTWGSITGTLSNQIDLQVALNLKAAEIDLQNHITDFSNPHNVTLAQVGGTLDHGSLSGLSDDDHPQYLNTARADLAYLRLDASNDPVTGQLNIQVPTATSSALVLKTTDDDPTTSLFETRDMAGNPVFTLRSNITTAATSNYFNLSPTQAIDGNWTAARIIGAPIGTTGFRTLLQTQMVPGYTGGSTTIVLSFVNNTAGTATGALAGNIGINGNTSAIGSGNNWGGIFTATNSTGRNTGIFGRAVTNNTGIDIGVWGVATNTNASGFKIAGYFSNSGSFAPNTNAALAANNSTTTSDIIQGYDNDVLTFRHADGGGTLIDLTNAASVGLTVQAAAAQSANLFEIENSSATVLTYINSAGNVGVRMGTTAATAYLHIAAGTTAASTAPIKLTSGTNMTAAEAGAIEFTTDDFFATITTGAARKAFILDDGTRLTSGRVPFATTNGRLIDDADFTFATDTLTVDKVSVDDDAYGSGWNGSTNVPTKNAIYDKLETIASDVLFDHYADVGNIGTGEDDLYSDTITASQLSADGQKLVATYQGTFTGAAASTQELRIRFAGTVIYDSGALAIGVATNNWTAKVTIIRESSTIVRCSVALSTDFGTLFPYSSYTRITGLTLSNTNILKITGESAGVGAANDQIVAKLSYIEFKPAA